MRRLRRRYRSHGRRKSRRGYRISRGGIRL